ncbi:MAG: hypothetical protein LBD71_02995 [Treponema sp.]|jgi:hypothetical protein|nr:hypothetical protein [Treponema sp.]
MKNKPIDLNDHLFEQMERLNDDDLNEEGLKKEVIRAKAMCDVAAQITAGRRLVLDVVKASQISPEVKKEVLLTGKTDG